MAVECDAARHPATSSAHLHTSSVPLLREHDDEHDRDGHDGTATGSGPLLQARLRLYWLATVLCCGALLFGYDSGLIGGVLTFESFHADFRFGKYGAPSETTVSAMAVGSQQIGALVGCLAIWPVNNYRGRRMAIGVCAMVFCMGVALELFNGLSLSWFYLGRFTAGLGVGGSSSVIPIYLSEMAPKDMRGQLGSCYQFMFTIGIFVSYWIDYAVGQMARGSAQWQIPFALQLVPGALMGFGVLTLHESVRWLSARGEHEAARRSLEWIRAAAAADDSTSIANELAEIRAAIDDEQREKSGLTVRELFCEWPNTHRILLGIGIFFAQQSTGATALAYFGPQFFALIVGPGSTTLLLTGIFGFIKVASCGMFILFLSDRFGRKVLLFAGAAGMAVCMFVTAALVRSIQGIAYGSPSAAADDGGAGAHVETDRSGSTGIVTILLIYLSIIFFNLSWGPLPWPYTSEIFPTRIRESGVTCGVAAQWTFNLVWSAGTPFLLASLGWATFALFGVLDVAVLVFVVVCLKETARKSLEQISDMFDPGVAAAAGVDGIEDEGDRGGLLRDYADR